MQSVMKRNLAIIFGLSSGLALTMVWSVAGLTASDGIATKLPRLAAPLKSNLRVIINDMPTMAGTTIPSGTFVRVNNLKSTNEIRIDNPSHRENDPALRQPGSIVNSDDVEVEVVDSLKNKSLLEKLSKQTYVVSRATVDQYSTPISNQEFAEEADEDGDQPIQTLDPKASHASPLNGHFKNAFDMTSSLKSLQNAASGLDECAFDRTVGFINEHFSEIENQRYVTIVDYDKPSTEKRMFIFDLEKRSVDVLLAAHGKNSGLTAATKFGDSFGSDMTSLGFFLTGKQILISPSSAHQKRRKHSRRTQLASDKPRPALQLLGQEDSDKNAVVRGIVMHCAAYVSPAALKAHGRLGRSWGCPAIECGEKFIALRTELSGGSVFYHHAHNLCVGGGNTD